MTYIGVLQFYPQRKQKDKDQVYIYLDRRMVEQEEYLRLKFGFVMYRAIEQYWAMKLTAVARHV